MSRYAYLMFATNAPDSFINVFYVPFRIVTVLLRGIDTKSIGKDTKKIVNTNAKIVRKVFIDRMSYPIMVAYLNISLYWRKTAKGSKK